MKEFDIDPSEYSVLVCDDEESIRMVLSEALSDWGFEVATAPNGESALKYIQAGNIPHVVLTDIRMGGMTGIQLSSEVKKISDEIEVIIMTSHASFETAVEAMRIGVYDYLTKPFDNLEDVLYVIKHVCRRIYMRLYSEYLMEELERKNKEVACLADMSQDLSDTLDVAKIIEIGCRGLSQGFEDSPVIFFQYLKSKEILMATTRFPNTVFAGARPTYSLPESIIGSQEAKASYINEIDENQEFLQFLKDSEELSDGEIDKQGKWVTFPLVTRGVPQGLFSMKVSFWDEEADSLSKRYSNAIRTSFENGVLHAKVLNASIRDGLTKLYNVRYFKERFGNMMEMARRLNHPMSLIFFDVDHFKQYNDTHGHPAGDEVLRRIAEILKQAFRSTDLCARYGGEEFVVLMPHTALADALEKAEILRKLIEDTPFENEQTQPEGKVTATVGVSEFPLHGNDVQAVVKSADDALYKGKKSKRNQVVAGQAVEGYVPPFVVGHIDTRGTKE